MIPHRVPFFLPLLYPALTWRMPQYEKRLYLTFDDGPVSGPTEFALDTLARAAVRATFFCIGDNITRFPGVFASLIQGGHAIGNHTANHVNGWKVDTKTYLSSVYRFNNIAREHGLRPAPSLFRPPYGRLTRAQIRALSDYRVIMWDVLSQDYNQGLSPEKCLRGTLRACRPGSIVVFHDSYKACRNMEYVLPRLIDHFGGLGFSFGLVG